MKTLVTGVLVAVWAFTLSACQDVCACSPQLAGARVHGTVTAASGGPVPGALVRGYNAPAAGCHYTGYPDEASGSVLSNTDGSFVLHLASSLGRDTMCVFVYASPPEGSTFLTSDTTLVVLDFRYEGQLDTARVDPILRLP
jgi:hypothetical protein